MRAHIESTDQIVTISPNIKARVWKGVTESGVPFQCLIPSIAVEAWERSDEFDAELKAIPHAPAPDHRAYDPRVIL